MNPYDELEKQLELTPVVRCPKCGQMSLSAEENRLLCTKCGFRYNLKE